MLTHHQIEVAARIGMLSREPDSAAAGREALRALTETMPTDAATLVGLDPVTGDHLQLAGLGYDPADSNRLAARFTGTPWHDKVLTAALPVSISEEAGQSFRQGWFYAEHVRPAGFRDAVTAALRHHGRYVGLITLSACSAHVFDLERRRLLAALTPALAAIADLNGRIARSTEIPAGACASLVTGDRTVDLPGHDRPPMLGDATFRATVTEFAPWTGHRLSMLWPVGRGWHRVTLTHRRLIGGRPAVLVVAGPTEAPYALSPRELDVMTRTAMGQSNQAIAEGLFLSPRTVHSHIEHILRKTGTTSRAEIAALAVREDLIRPTPSLTPAAGLRWFVKR